MSEFIKDNLEKVTENIRNAKERRGSKEDVEIVAVTKTRDVNTIRESVKCGINTIGENKIQEAITKYDALKDLYLDWHFVGHLQTNKIRKALEFFKLIHSVDKFRLAKEIDEYSREVNKVQNILLQVNISEEESKFGLKENELDDFFESLSYEKLKNIRVKGLMTMAPFTSDEKIIRDCFKKTKELFEKLKNTNQRYVSMELLSMGMSNDYEIAVEEGANLLRIGTAIFGERE